jgi:hypothetical protein
MKTKIERYSLLSIVAMLLMFVGMGLLFILVGNEWDKKHPISGAISRVIGAVALIIVGSFLCSPHPTIMPFLDVVSGVVGTVMFLLGMLTMVTLVVEDEERIPHKK